MNDFSKVSILVDNDSWILPELKGLVDALALRDIEASLVKRQEDIPDGDICFFLGCTGLVEPAILTRNKHNLVVHESALPAGKGFAPMTWSILAGSNSIPVCLFEAVDSPDAGNIWIEDKIVLDGYELCVDWRHKQAAKTIELCLMFIDNYKQLQPRPQSGDESFLSRRTHQDSELDSSRTIQEQFNLLRVVDNERYPAFFSIDGHKYTIRISRND